jgi:ferredoxin
VVLNHDPVLENGERDQMKAFVDQGLCQGHGQCEEDAPDIFEVRDDGFAYVLRDFDAVDLPRVRDAASRCPVDAITIED